MKINRLDYTKSLFPHFYDKTDESNFTKHLKIVGKQQYDMRHKLKTVEWSRILEKPLQIWKEQSKSYVYDMHFKVLVPNIKQINIYKNPVINDEEEIVGYEELCYTEEHSYAENVRFFDKILYKLQSPNHMIPRDTFVLEVFTWDDYHFLKGFPENDYTVKEDNILDYRYNETFLSIKLEEISYSKYLTFRVHKDKIKHIIIYKNEVPFITHEFDFERIGSSTPSDFSYTYFDDSITNEETYLQGNFDSYYEIENLEDGDTNNVKRYYVDTGKDEYVFRLPLTDDDFDDDGVVKDIYDLEVRTFEKRYRCRQEYDKVYSKRYVGYDEQLNDCFDHDYSLDMIGRLLNVHRFRFYQTYSETDKYLSRTYPAYNNRATEDDYHYMKRIQFYISNYNHIVFPVLEFWKYYHTFATIKSRKRIVGEMDNVYFRTNYDSTCLDENDKPLYVAEDLIEEEFESETITEYSINKATVISGDGTFVSLGDGWYESTVVNDVYVIPSISYRLQYTVDENEVDVTPRLICYNRKGVELRTTPIIVDSNVEDKDTEVLISIPSDTASVKVVLESNSSFKFSKVAFERVTVLNFDNTYMGTDEDYNSNVYELSVDYEDLPTNLRIGGDRFYILFKRSLPLTKRGFFYVSMGESDKSDSNKNYLDISTRIEFYATQILEGSQTSGEISDGHDYEETVTSFIKEDCSYILRYTLHSDDVTTTYDSDGYLPIIDDGELVKATVTYYESDSTEIGSEILEHEVYSDTDARVTQQFETPNDTSYITINISSEISATLTDIELIRNEKLDDDEVSL